MVEPIKVFCRKCHSKLDVSDLEPFTEFECPICGQHLRTPKKFQRYLLEKICGNGGTSIIYRAIDPLLARRVAVKILRTEAKSSVASNRFLDEAKLVGKLNHPRIIPVYDCGVEDDTPFLVMKFMEKGDLETQMKHGMLPNRSILLSYLADIAMALEFLHRNQVVHHDIKPSNIMVSAENEAKLGDFDLADTRVDGDLGSMEDAWGSPGYISPERLYGGGEDYKGDIFSLGVTIYEMLSGDLPFGITGTPEELYKRRQEPFVSLAEKNSEINRNLSNLVSDMLRFDSEKRPEYPEIIRVLRAASSQERISIRLIRLK